MRLGIGVEVQLLAAAVELQPVVMVYKEVESQAGCAPSEPLFLVVEVVWEEVCLVRRVVVGQKPVVFVSSIAVVPY